MSPDKHAILGAAPGCANFFLVNGSSGHGVMHAPALGHLLAEIILDGRATTIDTTPLRPGRFAENDLNPVSELLWTCVERMAEAECLAAPVITRTCHSSSSLALQLTLSG